MSRIERTTPTVDDEVGAAEAWERALAASAEVALVAPTAYSVGVHLARVDAAHHAHDLANLEAKQGDPERYRGLSEERILWARAEALRDLIATLPATSLRDAAVILAEAHLVADRLNSNEHTPDEVTEETAKLTRMLATSLPWIAQAAGLDVGEMEWTARCDLGRHYFVGVSGEKHGGVQP